MRLKCDIAKKNNFQIFNNNDKHFNVKFRKKESRLFPQRMKVHKQPKYIMQNALTEDWLHVASFQMQTIPFKNVDVSEYMDPV